MEPYYAILDLRTAKGREAAKFYAVLIEKEQPEKAKEIERCVMLALAEQATA